VGQPDSVRIHGEEDCLYLNVWTPATTGSDRPVMVFIHGGGNQQGSASPPPGGFEIYNGRYLAGRTGAVVVTLNYRLGPLGYLAHPGLGAENAENRSGNYGLLDQLLALRWVQDNIAQFGGDPSRVMIFGESAGAVNVGLLLISPLAEGLFSRALMQSGTPTARPALVRRAEGTAFAAEMGCGQGTPEEQIACLRSLNPEALIADLASPVEGGIASPGWGAAIDGWVVPMNPFQALQQGAFNHMPVAIGSTADEMSVSAPLVVTPANVELLFDLYVPEEFEAEGLELYPPGTTNIQARQSYVQAVTDAQFTAPARRVARAIAANQEEPVWRYFFNHSLSGIFSFLGAYHGLELIYVFQTIEDTNFNITPGDEAVESLMRSYWSRFADTGDPNGDGQPEWPQYEPAADTYIEIKPAAEAGAGLRTVKSDYWDRILGLTPTRVEEPASKQGFTMQMLSPNPVRDGSVNVFLQLDRQSKLDIRLYDVRGREKATLYQGALTAGEHVLPLDLGRTANGMYLLRARAGREVKALRMVVLRR
jgi:para-nitrobenzyl esterase